MSSEDSFLGRASLGTSTGFAATPSSEERNTVDVGMSVWTVGTRVAVGDDVAAGAGVDVAAVAVAVGDVLRVETISLPRKPPRWLERASSRFPLPLRSCWSFQHHPHRDIQRPKPRRLSLPKPTETL